MNFVHDIKSLTAAACFLLAAASGIAAESTVSFPFFKDIVIPEDAKDASFSVFSIDDDIYREAALIPEDIRIFGPNDELRPFIVSEEKRLDRDRAVESYLPATVTGFESLPDGSVRISASISTAGIPDSADLQVVGLRILTNAKNFDKKVKVFAGDGETPVAEGAFLDYSSRVDLRNDTIQFSVPTKESSFVIVMDNYTEIKDSPLFRVIQGDSNSVEQEKYRESPKINGISLKVVRKQQSLYPVSASSPVTILSREKKGKTTVVKFSNGSAPVSSITVESSDTFFSRPYRLYGKSGRLVASGTVRRLSTGSFHTETSERVIRVPAASRSESWTLELDNGEYDELKDIVLYASGPVWQIRFLSMKSAAPAEFGETSPSGFRVFYGGSGHPAPSADFTDALRSGSDPVPSDCTLSAQQDNPQFRAQGIPVRNWGLLYKILMGVAAFAVLLILLFSVRKIDKAAD